MTDGAKQHNMCPGDRSSQVVTSFHAFPLALRTAAGTGELCPPQTTPSLVELPRHRITVAGVKST